MHSTITRRAALKGGAAMLAGTLAAPAILRAAETVNVGSLTPNTGGGGPFGPNITAAHKYVADLVNAQGGILGREISLTQENSETNPETAARAADKLINVNGVLAILGTWSSSVTLGIMPKCQEAGVIQMCTSSSSDIPVRDEKGLVFNFQALSPVWGRAIGNLAGLSRGAAFLGILTADDAGAYDPARTDTQQHLRPAAWYRRRLSRHFVNVGGGLHLKRPPDVVVWALDRV